MLTIEGPMIAIAAVLAGAILGLLFVATRRR